MKCGSTKNNFTVSPLCVTHELIEMIAAFYETKGVSGDAVISPSGPGTGFDGTWTGRPRGQDMRRQREPLSDSRTRDRINWCISFYSIFQLKRSLNCETVKLFSWIEHHYWIWSVFWGGRHARYRPALESPLPSMTTTPFACPHFPTICSFPL